MIFQIILLTLGVLVLISWVNRLRESKKINLPGPFPLPIIGNAHMFLGSAEEFFAIIDELVIKYGPVFRTYILNRRYMLLSLPQHIEPIISSTEFITKGISYYYLEPWLGKGLLTSGGNRWKAHRKFLTPAFHFNILQNFLPAFCKNSKILVKKLGKKADGLTNIDMFPIIALAALDNVTESIMGVCVNAQEDSESQYVKAIEDLSNLVSTRMRNPLVAEDAIFNLLPHKGRQDRALKILHGQTRKVIDARREDLIKLNISKLNYDSEYGIKNKHAFLDLLLLAEIDGNKIDDEKVREEVDTFMFEFTGNVDIRDCLTANSTTAASGVASGTGSGTNGVNWNFFSSYCPETVAGGCGAMFNSLNLATNVTTIVTGHDTTTSGIVFSLFCISKMNDVQERILSEQRDIFGNDFERDPTYTELGQMKYLEMVIKEALRLYPSVPFIERLITSDADIAGLHIPKNTSVIFDFFHMHRNPDVFEDPLAFRPERFNADSKEIKNPFSWLPFSAGPRNCIGQKFAMMELKVTLSFVLRHFKLIPSHKEPILCADLILRSKDGVFVKLVHRK